MPISAICSDIRSNNSQIKRYNDSPKNNTWFYLIAILKIHFKYIASISTLLFRRLGIQFFIRIFVTSVSGLSLNGGLYLLQK